MNYKRHCKVCPHPEFGSITHPDTGVPYLQSTNKPGNMLTRGMLLSRDIRVASSKRGGNMVQFGKNRTCNPQNIGQCGRNKMGSWFGAPNGSRAPPRNTF